MYKLFSDSQNIEKMVREIVVFVEEETLEVTLLNWKGNPLPCNYDNWVKYVSSKSKNPREVFIYWDRKVEDDFLSEIANKLLNKKGYFEKLEKYFLKSYDYFKKHSDIFLKKGQDFYNRKTNGEIIGLFYNFNRYNKRALTAYYVIYDTVAILLQLVKKEIERIFNCSTKEKSDNILKTISSVGINTIIKTEKLEFLKKLKFIQKIYKQKSDFKNKKIDNIIFNHWYKFGPCCFTHEENRVYTLDDYRKKFFKNIRLDVDEEMRKIKGSENKDKKTVKYYLTKLNNYPEVRQYVIWLRKMMAYRNCEVEYYYVYFDHFSVFFNEIAKRLNIKLDDLWLLAKKEIISCLLKKKNATKIILERKKRGFTIKQVGNKIKVWTGIRKEDWYEKEIKNQTILKGMGVYIGKAKNKVKIIFNPKEEANNFQKGDILVTSMTTVDFVPLIKKAKAIITDEGGLLCHAAIVARELKTPCIIGTKIATKVLKDGDLVEVDANKGTVKLLKKNAYKNI